jgi:hypothetical protein
MSYDLADAALCLGECDVSPDRWRTGTRVVFQAAIYHEASAQPDGLAGVSERAGGGGGRGGQRGRGQQADGAHSADCVADLFHQQVSFR